MRGLKGKFLYGKGGGGGEMDALVNRKKRMMK